MEAHQSKKIKLAAEAGRKAEYEYLPISQPKRIRLLQLLPYHDGDPNDIHCRLFEATLHSSHNALRPFEVLSYCWGSELKTRSITITNGPDRELRITQNLYAALLQLQDSDIARTLWIDAVCINQSDNEEKGHHSSKPEGT